MSNIPGRKSQAKEDIRSAFENKIDVEFIPPTVADFEDGATKAKVRIAPYCRVSTDSDEQLASYELQTQYYRELVNSRPDWELISVYADEGISGTSLRKREQFLQMVEDCKEGKIDMIITKSIARFARNVVDCVSTTRLLKNLNPPVAIYFEDININTLTQTGELLLILMAAVAQGESETKSSSVKWGFRKRFQAGIPKIAPLFGFQKEGRELFVSDPEATIVRLIFHALIDGYSIPEICSLLNSQAIPSPKGKLWTYSTIRSILTNERHCGDVLMQKTIAVDLFANKTIKNDGRVGQYRLKNHHEPIVTKEVWLQAQEILAKGSHKRDSWDYWLETSEDEDLPLAGFSVIKNKKEVEDK